VLDEPDEQVVFVVNPASANGSTRRRWPEIARQAAELGLSGRSLLSERPGQIADHARSASEDGATLVVAVGGDGTVNEAVNGLMEVGAEKRAEMGRKGRDRVQQLYSKQALQTATMAVYQRVLREAAERRAGKPEGAPVL